VHHPGAGVVWAVVARVYSRVNSDCADVCDAAVVDLAAKAVGETERIEADRQGDDTGVQVEASVLEQRLETQLVSRPDHPVVDQGDAEETETLVQDV